LDEEFMNYFVLKWIHILSSTILFGTGIGSAFYMFVANRRGNIADIRFVTKHVVIADWMFTSPAVIIQLVTGIALVQVAGHAWSSAWIIWGVGLYVLAGACWLPVVWIQIQMRDIAQLSFETREALPDRYDKLDRWWVALGSLAFPTVAIIFWLMVSKPV
jgi:uncharacterized membrane protein